MVIVANQLAHLCQWGLNTVLPENGADTTALLDKSLRSIAIITPFFIGDMVLSTTLIRNLANQCSVQTQIHCIAPEAHRSLLEALDCTGSPSLHLHAMPMDKAQMTALLRKLAPDAVFLLRYSLRWASAMMDAGIRFRIGFNLNRFGLSKLQRWGGLLTHAVSSGQFDAEEHQLEGYKAMLLQLGWYWNETIRPHFDLSPCDYQWVAPILADNPAPRIIIHLTAGSPGKRWPLTNWAAVLEEIQASSGGSVLAVGTAKDALQYEALAGYTGIPITNLCGKTTLRQSAVLCQQADLVLTLDTSLAHIAAAVEAPRLVVLYGPTNVAQWRPLVSAKTHLEQVFVDVPCRPCLTRACYHRSCMRLLTPERVLHHIHRAMHANTY